MKKTIIAAVLSLGLAGCGASASTSNDIELFFMYSDESGAYFLDPSADVENVIFVDFESMHEWKISTDLHHGTKVVGSFDDSGWDLHGLRLIEGR